MRPARRFAISLAIVLTLGPCDVSGEPVNLRIKSSSRLTTDAGTDLRLPPGYFLDDASRAKLDLEVKRLQEVETKLTAENRTMRRALSGWRPGWKTLTFAIGSALITGAYFGRKL